MHFKHFSLLIYIFLIIFYSAVLSANSIELCIYSGSKINYETIDETFKQPFLLENLSFEADSYFEKSEFNYLTDLKEQETITAQNLKNACFYLKQKNKFDEISILISNGQTGKNIHFKLKSFYTFSKINISGILIGKDRYIHFYLLEPGEKFDLEKHEKSISKMKKVLHKQGFFDTDICSKFDYDEKNKTITAQVYINKGKHFSIKNVNFKIKKSRLNKAELEKLKKDLKKIFFKKFRKITYSSKILKNKRTILKNYLEKQNLSCSKISFKKEIDYNNQLINLNVNIFLEKSKNWSFRGNKYFTEDQLKKFFLSEEQYFSDLPHSIIAQELCQLYKQKGFWEVSVNSSEKNNCYDFEINEGPRACIEKFVINGAQELDKKTIMKKFFTHLLKTKYLNNEDLAFSINNLMSFYLKLGFWDVKIDKKLMPVENSGKYIVEINIIEGARKFLKSVSIDKAKELESVFADSLNLKQAIPFDINILNEQSKYLSNYFHKKGYQNITLTPEFISDDPGIKLNWKINVNESNLKFGKTVIQGNNNKIPFEKILRETIIEENETWKKEKLEQTFFNLSDLKIFDSVQLYPSNYLDFNNNKPIILKLILDEAFEIRTRFGLQEVSRNLALKGHFTYKIGGSFIYKNPFSRCDQFKIDADFSTVQKMFLFQYRIPWIFGANVRTSFELYGNTYYQPLYIGSNKNLYQVSDLGFLATFTKKYGKINTGLNCGIETIKIFGLSESLAIAIDFSPTLIDRRVPYFVLEPNIIIDQVDDKLNPTVGALTVFSIKSMFSFQNSKDYFLNFLIEQSFFCNILKPNVIAIRLRFGKIFTEKFNRLMPSVRYYLGGPNSIRSYKPDFSPPFGFFIDENGKEQFVPQGGTTMFNANFELRIAAFNNLSMVLFNDIGFLFKDSYKPQFKELLTATGFGFRYKTPIGPLRFDIGWRPKDFKNDSSFAWYLTLGHAF